MSVKTRTTGFYRDDAAHIAALAATSAPPPQPSPNRRPIFDEFDTEPLVPRRPAQRRPPVIELDEPERPPLAPEPAINENRATARRPVDSETNERPQIRRVIAWIVVAPFYAATIVGTGATLFVAAKFFLKF